MRMFGLKKAQQRIMRKELKSQRRRNNKNNNNNKKKKTLKRSVEDDDVKMERVLIGETTRHQEKSRISARSLRLREAAAIVKGSGVKGIDSEDEELDRALKDLRVALSGMGVNGVSLLSSLTLFVCV